MWRQTSLWLLKYLKYRVIRKSLRDFRPLRYSSREGHAEAEHVNKGRDTPNFCPTLQVLDMSTTGDAEDVNPVIKFLPHICNVYTPLLSPIRATCPTHLILLDLISRTMLGE